MDLFEALRDAVGALDRVVASPTRAVLRPTPAQLLLLRAMDDAAQPLAVSDVAKPIGCTQPNASEMVGRLVSIGWLERVTNERRPNLRAVRLTDRGRWVLDVAAARTKPMLADVFAKLRPRQRRALGRYLEGLRVRCGRACRRATNGSALDVIARGGGENAPPAARDPESEMRRRRIAEARKMSFVFNASFDELRSWGMRVPEGAELELEEG